MSSTVVGVAGLGAMGSRLADRLLTSGFEVHGWNRSPDRASHLDSAGLRRHASPRELASRCDVVLMMLWDDDAVSNAVHGDDGVLAGLQPDTVLVDLSTVSPETAKSLAVEVEAVGAGLLDCPVSGSLDRAESGELIVFAGGSAADVATARPVLSVLASRVEHVSETHGGGLAVKAAVNLQIALQLIAWGESMAVVRRFGVAESRATDVMLASVIGSPMLHYRIPFVADPPVDVWASVSLLLKDVRYAHAAGAAGFATADALELLEQLVADGLGDREAVELAGAALRRALASEVSR